MLEFTERFMEDCVAETPRAFFPDAEAVIGRQKSLSGFRPDLIVKDSSGRTCILELQVRALDRGHLYKCLEYRDLLHETEGGEIPRVVLMCEEVPKRYHRTLATHGVETLIIPREEFLKVAVRKCPNAMESHLLDSLHRADVQIARGRPAEPQVESFAWRDHCDPLEVFDHLSRQLEKVGLNRFKLPLPYQNDIYDSLYRFLKGPLLKRRSELCDFRNWRLERLFTRRGQQPLGEYILASEPSGRDFRKPRLVVAPYVTSKGNFSVLWYPDRQLWASTGDFKRWSEHRPSYGRPENELMYISGVGHLNLGRRFDLSWGHPEYVDVLDELLVCLLRASFNHLISVIRLHCDVELINDFEFGLENMNDDRDEERFPDHRVTTWSLYNLEERRSDEEQAWHGAFEQNYGLSFAEFVRFWLGEVERPRRSPKHTHRHMASRLAEHGIILSAHQCRTIMDRLLTRYHQWRLPDALLAAVQPVNEE